MQLTKLIGANSLHSLPWGIKNVNKICNFRKAKFSPDSCSLRKIRSLFDSKIRTDLRHMFAFIHYLIHYPQGGSCAKSALASCRSAESSRNLYRPWAWKSLCKSNIDHEKDGCQATWKILFSSFILQKWLASTGPFYSPCPEARPVCFHLRELPPNERSTRSGWVVPLSDV